MIPVNRIYHASAFDAIKHLDDNTVRLVVTSPPYANIRKSYPGPSPHDFVDWFSPLCKEILRTLTDDGSFILNINDKCVKGERIPYPFETVIHLREMGFKLIDTIIWVKKNGAVAAGRRRADYFEYVFHLAKTTKPIWNPDGIRTPYAASSKKRAEKPIKNNVSNREGRKSTQYKKWNLHPNGAYPKNVQYFPKDGGKNHVAAYHIELPLHFIESHSNPGDLVLDPFAGRGTTLAAARQLNRKYIGFEILEDHVKLAEEVYKIDRGVINEDRSHRAQAAQAQQ